MRGICPPARQHGAFRCWKRRSSWRIRSRPGRVSGTLPALSEPCLSRMVFPGQGRTCMARKAKKRRYSRSSGSDVEGEMKRYKKGTAKSGPGGRGGRVKSRKQAIAIGLSKARKKGKKVPKKASKRKTSKKTSKKTSRKTSKKTSKKTLKKTSKRDSSKRSR